MSTLARLSVDEYERIVATGVFDGMYRRRVELIHGEIRDMNPIGPPHAQVVDLLNRWSFLATKNAAVQIRIQSSLKIAELDSEPEPDVLWLALRDYSKHHPSPDEVYLIIEVADSSLRFERGEKADLYAAAGIKDYWIVNIPEQCVEVLRDPEQGHYRSQTTHRAGEEIHPLAFPNVSLPVARLFGGQ